MERRTFLAGGAAAAAGLVTQPAASHYYNNEWVKSPPGLPLAPSDLEAAVARLRKQFLAEFDAAYVENVIVPHFLVSVYEGERLFLPMIDVEFTKDRFHLIFGDCLARRGSPPLSMASPCSCKDSKSEGRIIGASGFT